LSCPVADECHAYLLHVSVDPEGSTAILSAIAGAGLVGVWFCGSAVLLYGDQ